MNSFPAIFSPEMILALLNGKSQTRRLPNSMWNKVQVGDFIYVRETGAWLKKETSDQKLKLVVYRACCSKGKEPPEFISNSWQPSIHMPRWASRMTLEVTDIRRQPVQNISDEDALAEGVFEALESSELQNGKSGFGKVSEEDKSIILRCQFGSPAKAFNWLWDGIYGQDKVKGWEANPEVLAFTFKRYMQNVDEFLEVQEAA